MGLSLRLWQAMVLALLILVAPDSEAQQRNTITVHRGENAPVIDGVLDEAVWRSATVVDKLTLQQPTQGGEPSQSTRFYLYYDDVALYIGAELNDAEPDRIIRRQLLQNQSVVDDDYIQIFIDPYDTRRRAYLFYVNPNGVQRDGLVFGTRRFNMNWDGIWQAKAQVTDKGWSVELAFPFKTLSFDPQQSAWGINLLRAIRRSGEEAGWSLRDNRLTLDAMGLAQGITGVDPGRGLDVVPSFALTERKQFSPDQSDAKLEPSLDVFYRVTPSLTSSFTLNTDFSATEVDDRQVNLTRFSLFFPEKRDFFLRDTDIFEFGELAQNGRPFFSRTIGLSPMGTPVDLVGGAKLTGRQGPWSIGVLGVRQDEFENQAASDLGVARVFRRVLDQSTLGGIITYGDPSSDRNNWVGGLDFQFRNTRWIPGQSLEGEVWYQQSETEGLTGDDSAFGIRLRYPNDRTDAALGFSEIQADFNPAMGFVNRSAIRTFNAHFRRKIRFRDHWIRSYRAGVESEEIRDLNDVLETRITKFELAQLFSRQGDQFDAYVLRQTEVLSAPFDLLGQATINAGRYDFDRYGVFLRTPGFRTLGFNFKAETGDFFDGTRFDASATLNYRPNRYFRGALSYTSNHIDLPGGKFVSRIIAARASVAFNVEWSWISFAQYDNVSDRLGVNTRVRWIPQQGRELFLVLNYDFIDPGNQHFRSNVRDTALKFNYTFRF
jgi:hypothetical protein